MWALSRKTSEAISRLNLKLVLGNQDNHSECLSIFEAIEWSHFRELQASSQLSGFCSIYNLKVPSVALTIGLAIHSLQVS